MTFVDAIHQQGFHILDDFLNESHFSDLQRMAKGIEANEQFRPAKIGQMQSHAHNTMVRRDKIHWIDEYNSHHAIQAYVEKLKRISQQLNESLFLGLVGFEAHFAIYQPGDFYKKHVDQFKKTQDRRISCVYYLNEPWQKAYGGALKIYNTNNELVTTVFPQANRCIIFTSDLPHEVCETFHKRYSIAAWLKVRSMPSF